MNGSRHGINAGRRQRSVAPARGFPSYHPLPPASPHRPRRLDRGWGACRHGDREARTAATKTIESFMGRLRAVARQAASRAGPSQPWRECQVFADGARAGQERAAAVQPASDPDAGMATTGSLAQ